jgi:hypothetical protein
LSSIRTTSAPIPRAPPVISAVRPDNTGNSVLFLLLISMSSMMPRDPTALYISSYFASAKISLTGFFDRHIATIVTIIIIAQPINRNIDHKHEI